MAFRPIPETRIGVKPGFVQVTVFVVDQIGLDLFPLFLEIRQIPGIIRIPGGHEQKHSHGFSLCPPAFSPVNVSRMSMNISVNRTRSRLSGQIL